MVKVARWNWMDCESLWLMSSSILDWPKASTGVVLRSVRRRSYARWSRPAAQRTKSARRTAQAPNLIHAPITRQTLLGSFLLISRSSSDLPKAQEMSKRISSSTRRSVARDFRL